MATYSDKLKDPRWQKKRLEILQRDNWKCVFCEDDKKTLHIHHEKYYKEPWDANNSDLITLCKECHDITEEFKKSKSKVFLISLKHSNNGLYYKEVYSKIMDLFRITLYLYNQDKELVSSISVTEESLLRHYNKIQEIKNV